MHSSVSARPTPAPLCAGSPGPQSHPRRNNSKHGNQKQRRDRASHGTPPFTQGMNGTTEGVALNHDQVQVGVFSRGTPLAVTPLQCKPPPACPTSCFTSRRPPGRPQPIASSLRDGHVKSMIPKSCGLFGEVMLEITDWWITGQQSEVARWRSPRRSTPRRRPVTAASRLPRLPAPRSTPFSPRCVRSSAVLRPGAAAG
jgi:hypothetical protein